MFYRNLNLSVCLALSLFTLPAHAGISLNTTRVIFDGKSQEASVVIRNGERNVLAQSWLEGLAPDSDPPFALTPSLVKVGAKQQQLLRLIYQGAGLPTDRESVLWLNVQEVPEAAANNSLQFAVRQRIKVFYRPQALPGTAGAAPLALKWKLSDGAKPSLKIANPSAYHVSMVDVKGSGADEAPLALETLMIAPGAEVDLPLRTPAASGTKIVFDCINDYGAREHFEVLLSSNGPSMAIERKP
jgi:P pilus assembly chaperone PapD